MAILAQRTDTSGNRPTRSTGPATHTGPGRAAPAGAMSYTQGRDYLRPGGVLQLKRTPGASPAPTTASAPTSGGAPLPSVVQARMEQSFGVDLGHVRVQESPAVSAMGARAVASGSHVSFAPGQYDPHSLRGQEVLGHELTHVVQQSAGRVAAPAQGYGGLGVNSDASLEAEADRLGALAARGLPARVPGASNARGPARTAIPQCLKGLQVGDKIRDTRSGDIRTVVSVQADGNKYEIDTGEVLPHWRFVKATTKEVQAWERKLAGITDAPAEVRENTLVTDVYIDEHHGGMEVERQRAKTPRVMKSKVTLAEGQTAPVITPGHADFDETARIDVASTADETGVTLDLQLFCNPEYMCKTDGETKDLVPVTLEKADDDIVTYIAVVEPTEAQNTCRITTRFPYSTLASLLGLAEVAAEGDRAAGAALREAYPELGVKAQWLARNTDGKNAANHSSGGVLEKGGSGKVPLRAITLEDLVATEGHRNTEWNMGARLREGRPVYDEFSDILQLGKELATTLEAETEYYCRQDQVEGVIALMSGLAADASSWAGYGIQNMTDKGIKTYTDTYYDVRSEDGAVDLAMLKNQVVLRRRSVATDPPDTFLFAVKGRTVDSSGELIRLAAQANLSERELATEPGMAKFKAFLADRSADNAFARVIRDALHGLDLADLEPRHWQILPVMTIASTRHKFFMELANSTAIDFSADIATGTQIGGDGEASVCSFEFGVGHPGLVATNTGGASSGGRGPRPKVTRPYHVPADLENPALFEKPDYAQYQTLRDQLLGKLFGMDKRALDLGGNKASLLAARMGLLG